MKEVDVRAQRAVNTSDQEEVILAIDAIRARQPGVCLDDRFARVVRDLVLGVPVAGCELDEWGITAIGLLSEDEVAAKRSQYNLFH